MSNRAIEPPSGPEGDETPDRKYTAAPQNGARFIDLFWEICSRPDITKKYGENAKFALVILEPGEDHDWKDPLDTALVVAETHTDAGEPGGLYENVERKLRFSLRTGLNSVEARYNKHLILPGDFPYQGAGFHRGYWGGVSGLQEEQDWWVYCYFVDELIKLRENRMELLLAASRKPDRTIQEKYLLPPSWNADTGELEE